jgi:molybdate transport system regulatory protein
MDRGFEARLRADDTVFTRRDATLLRTVDETGSLSGAASELGRSYARAHQRVTELEAAFGPLVERQRGGSGGGGSTLTGNAREVLAGFDRLRAGYEAVAGTAETVLEGTVTERTGELGIVETAAGSLRAVVPPEADGVQVSIGADIVTLLTPSETPDSGATSARNRFEGTVTDIQRGEAISKVTVDVGAGPPLAAVVTEESLSRLSLAPGDEVVVSFKATATRATPRSGGEDGASPDGEREEEQAERGA